MERPAVTWLADWTAGRDNNVQLIRLLAATAVFAFHCYALTDRWTDEPLWRIANDVNLGALGVQVFFVVSGFLVTQSWIARERLDQFVVARALRIYPALIVATVWTIALAAMSSSVPFLGFIAHPQTGDYFYRTALGLGIRDRLPGAFATNPFPDAVNGSLWTLPIELRLYIAVAVGGVFGLVTRRALWTVALVAVALAIAYEPRWLVRALGGGEPAPLAMLAACFAAGSLACAWRAALPLSIVAALGVIALVVWNPGGVPRGALFPPLLAYIVLVAGYHPWLRFPAFNRIGDYSYGLYVYAFPIQQTVVQRAQGIGPAELFAYAFPVTLALAALSWHALEKPALGLKSRFD